MDTKDNLVSFSSLICGDTITYVPLDSLRVDKFSGTFSNSEYVCPRILYRVRSISKKFILSHSIPCAVIT